MPYCCRAFAFIGALLLLSGCSAWPEKTEPAAVPDSTGPAGTGWWSVRFHLHPTQTRAADDGESDDTGPNWSLDALIAGEIVAPTLARHRQHIELWRLHRRAGQDGNGHKFTFMFRSDAAMATAINREIKDHPGVAILVNSRRVERIEYDDPGTVSRPAISATSDPDWPEEVQASWPWYIMGVSRMWLELVETYAAQEAEIADIYMRYEKVQERITDTWSNVGQHAYFHHLSAIFSYQPLVFTRREMLQF